MCVERRNMACMSVLDKMIKHDETRIKLCTPLAIYGN